MRARAESSEGGGGRIAVGWLIRVVLSVALVGALLGQVDVWRVGGVLGSARLELVLGLVMLFVLERLLGAWRWHVLLRGHHGELRYGQTLQASFLSAFVGAFLPGAMGAEAMRMATMRHLTADGGSAASSVVLDRLLGTLVLLMLACVGLMLWPGDRPSGWAAVVAVLLALCVLALAGMLSARVGAWVMGWLVRTRWSWVQGFGGRFVSHAGYVAGRPAVLGQALGLSVLFQVIRVGGAPLAAMALGLEIGFWQVLVYVPLILLAMTLPISLGGLGVREVGFVYFFGGTAGEAEAMALGVLLGLATLAVQLPGAWVLIRGLSSGGGLKQPPSQQGI